MGDGSIVAVAGRRIDGTDTDPPRFPLEAVPTVRRRLGDLLVQERAVALVCSAACGSDLIALEEAEHLGLRRRIVLPFPRDRFRETSVVDRPGDWGRIFDRLVAAAIADGDLIILPGNDAGDEAAYAAVNEAIMREAQALARDKAHQRLLATVVWEGSARAGNDATDGFRKLAVDAGFDMRFVLTRPAAREAKDYLNGAALTAEQARDLVKRLKSEDRIGWARRVLAKIREENLGTPDLHLWFAQQHALCTYKDPDLPILKALDQALTILNGSFNLTKTDNQETLGIAGAIYKRRWQATGQKGELERSYRYYRRGYEAGLEKDRGYTGINAAFILDQLAEIELADETPSVEQRRTEARHMREAIVEKLPPLETAFPELATDWWYLVTVAEALFGVGEYVEARNWLLRAKAACRVSDWEFRSTATQLATLYQLQHLGTPSPNDPATAQAASILDAFLQSPAARESAFIGKVGLALSGGGFRASLYHIGVLAKLAEMDVLRRVEVLSCVSGGSIIGAQYYLQLRETLETIDFETLTEEEIRRIYIDIVERVAKDFLAGVQTNIRMRVFANPLPLLRSIVSRAYSRTVRLGELFEQQLFARVWSDAPRRKNDQLLLKQLRIQPKGAGSAFDPKVHNWRRKAKVPVLVLNATTLNTGHAWQYTASFMGESPWAIDPQADGTNRLRRMYHKEAPPTHQSTRLGQAVVASACVPGLFEPIRLDNLYRLEQRGRKGEPLVIRQVDGGVHDNQGIASLFEQGCSVVLVSDASGQTALAVDPGGGALAPLMRSNSVLMQRVRQEQYARLDAMRQGGLLKGAMFIHLKQDLEVVPVDWIGCDEPPEGSTHDNEPLAKYGVRKEVQELLAGVRTDLDSFSDVEAFTLMTSGYRMTEHYLPKVEVLPICAPEPRDWFFLAIERVTRDASTSSTAYRRLLRLLRSAGSRMFRIWTQSRVLLLVSSLVAAAGVALVIAWLFGAGNPSRTMIAVNGWTILSAIAIIVALAFPSFREHASRISIALLGILLWIPVHLHLCLTDRLFLWLGRVERLR